jgi:hypothetical protein
MPVSTSIQSIEGSLADEISDHLIFYSQRNLKEDVAPTAKPGALTWFLCGSGKYAMLPLRVLEDTRIKYEALRVLIALAKHADPKDGTCHPDRGKLAEVARLHPVNVSKATSLLIKHGWLRKSRQGSSTSYHYTLMVPSLPGGHPGTTWNPTAYGRYGIVPVEILADKRVKYEALKVFIALAAHADKVDGTCIPGRNTVSKLTHMHPNNVSNATRALVVAGWLEKTPRYLRSSIYRLKVPAIRTPNDTDKDLLENPDYSPLQDIESAPV